LLDAQKVPRCAAARQIQGKRCWLLRFDRGQRIHRFDRGQRIHARDTKGTAWRIVSGSVRLDREEPNGEQSFANLAIRGDVIGAETLLFGKYSFTATALTACVLESWPEGSASPVGDSLCVRWPKPSDAPPKSSPCAVVRLLTVSVAWS